MPKTSVREYFLFILGKKDYSIQQLVDKGISRGYDTSEIKEVINDLIKHGILDDARFASMLLDGYKGRKGVIWIRHKLISKKIPASVIDSVLDGFVSEPNNEFKQKVERKYNVTDWDDLDYALKTKIANYIARQGFPQPFDILQTWKEN